MLSRLLSLAFATLTLLALTPVPASAQIYVWRDAAGNMVLSDRPKDPSARTFAVATSDDRVPTERTLDALGVTAEFAAITCADDGIRTKPAPDPVLHLCAELGITPARTAVVGDSPADLSSHLRI